jgi:hypothetical protein
MYVNGAVFLNDERVVGRRSFGLPAVLAAILKRPRRAMLDYLDDFIRCSLGRLNLRPGLGVEDGRQGADADGGVNTAPQIEGNLDFITSVRSAHDIFLYGCVIDDALCRACCAMARTFERGNGTIAP